MRTSRIALLFLVAALMCGCSQKITIVQYPAFYTPDLKTIAVLPFKCAPGDGAAGDMISDQFARSLQANGTYQVFNRGDVAQLFKEQDFQKAVTGDDAQVARMFEKTGKVQAVLVGTVSTYSATTRSERRKEPRYTTDRYGNLVLAGYDEWTETHNEGTVVVHASLLRVSDGSGAAIYATPQPVAQTIRTTSSRWGSAKSDQFGCRAAATTAVVNGLVDQFAVVRKTVGVDPAKALRTANDFYDNRYSFTDAFSQDDKLMVVVSLPECCDRNRFRITVVRENDRKDLAELDLTWSRDWGPTHHFDLDLRKIATAGGGPGNYVVKFYSGPEPVFTRKMKIR